MGDLGYTGGGIPSLPGSEPKKLDNYKPNTTPAPIPKNERAVNGNVYNLLKWLVILLFLAVGVFGYLSYEGNFKTEIEIPECPTVEIPSCPSAPACPACPAFPNISNDCSFPSELNIIGNYSG